MGIGVFLVEEVYPRLDAVSVGLLDHLNPVLHGRYYEMDCPACEAKRRAFYYPGSAGIHCNRRNECGVRTSLWDLVTAHLGDKRETLHALCRGAGVAPPDRKTPRGVAVNREDALRRELFAICRTALADSATAMGYLQNERRLSAAEIEASRIGYYPSVDFIREQLKARKCDLALAQAWGLFSEKFARRVVGFWEQPNGGVYLWGRLTSPGTPYLTTAGETVLPNKYEYGFGLSKTMPYRWRAATRKGVLVAVEGPLDTERLAANGIPTIGVGGVEIIEAQAEFLAKAGVTEIIHLIDGDAAGRAGGLRSIANCEPFGITTFIASIPPELKDPDTAVAQSGIKVVVDLLAEAVAGGAFVASTVMDLNLLPANVRKVRELLGLRSRLTEASALAWDAEFARRGVAVPANQSGALRFLAELLDAGMTWDEAARLARKRFGITVNIGDPHE